MDEEEVAAICRNPEDFSASATVIPFDSPLPLLRGPVPAGLSDDPAASPFVLAFRDADSWRSAFRSTEAKMLVQCEAGARIGCSISASNKCKPPWWKVLFGIARMDYVDREQCEEREMATCLAAAKEACIQFAEERCLQPFRDARIASDSVNGSPPLVFWHHKTVEKELSGKRKDSEPACFVKEVSHGSLKSNCEISVTNYRGSDLLDGVFGENSQATAAD
ncbi:uncharacterized protein LOC122025474 [Zingiber officinale]|uniref:Uncharacterized protein n=1 Tax=Zingiber officinale TaxID=94328 RepID=A0A8J5F2J6_ZINOF|nr:uncharacterized protein LOC122025474 [Zingiber officinale]KAG6476468.1 hypothetical protein ZIOFF_065710 [Zingiber officinale]